MGFWPCPAAQDLKRAPMWRPAMDSSAGSSPLHLAALRGHAEVHFFRLEDHPRVCEKVANNTTYQYLSYIHCVLVS